MTPAEIEAALQAAFKHCDQSSCPLSERQKQILLQMVELVYLPLESPLTSDIAAGSDTANPLDELTSDQRHILLQFVKAHEQQNRPWKIQLLNDWLQERDSGPVQFVRDRYGTSMA